jgi:predicted Zn-dependent protease
MLLNENESKAICEKLLGYCKADDAEVSVFSEDSSHLRFAANGFTTSGRRENVTASVTLWVDKKRGSAATNDLDDPSLKMAADEAARLAHLSPVDKEYVPTLGPQRYQPTGGYVDATVNVSLKDRARSVDEIIRACENAGVIGAGFHHANGAAIGSASKNGNFHYQRSSLVSLSVTARTPDGGSSGYFLRNHFDVAKLEAARIGTIHSFCAELPVVIDFEVVCYLITEVKLLYLVYLSKPRMRV